MVIIHVFWPNLACVYSVYVICQRALYINSAADDHAMILMRRTP